MFKDIKYKIKHQRIHLVSTQHFLIEQFALKKEIIGFIQNSKDQLKHALPDDLSRFRKKLADDQHLYTQCKTLIRDLQTEIDITKTAIEKLKLKRHYLFFPKKTSGFFKQTQTNQIAYFSH